MILRHEDLRSLDSDGFLQTNLESSPYPEVRRWCALALGRIGDSRALPWLYEAFASPYSAVRATAAFAVGEIEDREILKQEFHNADPLAATRLGDLLRDSSLEVQMRAIEAIGKAGTSKDALKIARALEKIDYEATPLLHAYIDLAITALMRLKNAETYPQLHRLALADDSEIQWRATNALVRCRDLSAQPLFLRLLDSASTEVRAQAALGLGICGHPRLADALLPMLPARDSRTGRPVPLPVRFNALRALGMLKSVGSIQAIESVLRASPPTEDFPDQVNFAVAASGALADIGARDGEAALLYLLQFPGPAANGAIVALGRILKSEPSRFFQLAPSGQFTDPPALRAWAQALGELGGPEATAGLKSILARSTADQPTDSDTLAIPTVLRALEKAQAPDLPEILDVYVASHDGAVLRSALDAYKPSPSRKRPWTPIIGAYAGMAPVDDAETKVSILDHLEPWLSESEVQDALHAALNDRLRNVRIAAIRLLRKAGAAGAPQSAGESKTRLEPNGYEMIAGARQDRTVAILETDRGNIEVDLFREDAPLTVSNFVELAKRGYFEGQSFMRVVPFFVVQSGDPRNDQEGGPGYSIRCEINMRPFERGSIGMALAGKDTGGSQFFITLAPQPHLDGGYTCFGRVISGMQVVDRLTTHDRIRRVAIEEDRSALNFRIY